MVEDDDRSRDKFRKDWEEIIGQKTGEIMKVWNKVRETLICDGWVGGWVGGMYVSFGGLFSKPIFATKGDFAACFEIYEFCTHFCFFGIQSVNHEKRFLKLHLWNPLWPAKNAYSKRHPFHIQPSVTFRTNSFCISSA